MYRRKSSMNAVTPMLGRATGNRMSGMPMAATSVGKLQRTTSTLSVGRPSNILRGPRSSSVGRKSPFTPGKQSIQSSGRTSIAFGDNKPRPIKDPRPISDKNFQALMIQKLIDFMNQQDFQGLTEKQLRSPSRQDFINLFTFLYRHFDDEYEYKDKPLEVEIPEILRSIGYPFQVNPSTMKSFNAPHAWPTVLAAMSWLQEVVEFGLNFNFEKTFFPPSENDFAANATQPEETWSYAVYEYYNQCCIQSKEGKDDFSEFDQYLIDTLGAYGGATRIDQLTTENEKLTEELKTLETKLSEVDNLEKMVAVKRKDASNLDDYLRRMEEYSRMLLKSKEDLQQQHRAAKEKVQAINEEIERKKTAIAKQDIKPAQVELMAMKKVELKKRIIAYEKEKSDAEKANWQNEREIAEKRETIGALTSELSEKLKILVQAFPIVRSRQGELEIDPLRADFLERFEMDIVPWIKGVKSVITAEMDSMAGNTADSESQIAELKSQLDDLELETGVLERKIKQWDTDIQAYHDKKNQEYQKLCLELASVEDEHENAMRESTSAKEERSEKEKELENLTKQLEQKRMAYEQVEDKWERQLRKCMETVKGQVMDIQQMREEVVQKLLSVKEKIIKKK